MADEGITNTSFELSEAAENAEEDDRFPSAIDLNTGPRMLAVKKKVFRHNTDVAVFAARMKNDVILEDDVITTTRPPRPTSRHSKKTVLVSRHNTEVLQRRKATTPCYTPSRDQTEVHVTRRSVSRQSSSVTSRTQIQVTEDPQEIVRAVVISSRLDKKRKERLGSLITKAKNRQQAHVKLLPHSEDMAYTTAFNKALNIIQEERIAMLCGKMGSGKSYTADSLVNTLALQNEDHKIVYLSNIQDLEILDDSGHEYIAAIDDIFGELFFRQTSLYQLNSISLTLSKIIKSRRHFIILTSERKILAQALTFLKALPETTASSIIENTQTIDLDFSIYSNELGDLAACPDSTIGLPLLCFLQRIPGMDEGVILEPVNTVTNYWNFVRETLPCEFLAFAMTVAFNNNFRLEQANDMCETLNELCAILTLPRPSIEEVVEVVRNVSGCLLTEDPETKDIRFANGFLLCSFLKTMFSIAQKKRQELLKLLPIDVISLLCGESVSPCSVCITLSHSEYTTVLYKIKSLLQTKDPDVFKSIAACRLWKEDTFCNLAIAVIGIDIFLSEDKSEFSLMAYMAEECQSSVLIKVVDFLQTYRMNDFCDYQPSLARTLESALHQRLSDVVEALSNIVWKVDERVIEIVVRIGDIRFLKALLQNSIEAVKNQRQIVFMACKYNQLHVINYLLDLSDKDSKCALIQSKDVNGYSVMHFAAMADSPKVLKFLIDNGGDGSVQTKEGQTLLHIAAIYGNVEVVDFICHQFPDMLVYTDNHGFTAGHLAAREGHLDVLKMLVCPDIENKVHGANTIIHIAAYNGRNNVLKYLCLNYPDLIDVKNYDSFTAAQIAANVGIVDTWQLFIDIGTDINSKTVDGRSFLHLAAYQGESDLVCHIVQNYPQLLSIVDIDGNTVAHDAAASGKVDVFSNLLNHTNPRKQSYEGCTILHDACYYGRLEMVRFISSNFPDMIDTGTNNGFTPCHGAALGGFIDILSYLASKGADINAVSKDCSTILHEATFAGQYEMVKYICSNYPEMIEIRNVKSYTPNHFAAQEGHLDIFKLILSKGGSIDSVTNEGQTFLQIASYNGKMNVVKYICESFPSLLPIKDDNGAHAIHYAARGGHENVLMFLMAQGVDASAETDNGSTMLHLAAFDGRLEMVAHLCNRVPSLINQVDSAGHNAAHYAAGSGHLKLLDYLFGKGVDSMICTTNGCTLLLKAAFNGQTAMVQHLCEKYPKLIHMSDSFGCNALHYAACSGNIEMFTYFAGKGLDPMSQTNDEHSALHIAAYHGQVDLIKHLCTNYPELRHMFDGNGRTPAMFADMSDSREAQQFFKHDRERVALSRSSTACPCFCCCRSSPDWKSRLSLSSAVSSGFLQFLRGLTAMLCCCRRR